MKNKVITIEKEKCAALAESFFLYSSGLDRETEKNANVRESACRVRTQVETMLDLRAVFSFCDEPVLEGKILEVDGQKFMCDPFEQIGSGEVKAAVPFFLTAGNPVFDRMQVSDQVLADLWTNAYIQAASEVLKEYLEKQYGRLSNQFGPGLYGMSEGSGRRLARLADMRKIGISFNESGMMIPAKSLCGLYFAVEDTYRNLEAECLYCKGRAAGCSGCSVRHRHDTEQREEKQKITLPPDFSPDKGKTGCGVAIDIGTTTLAVMLWDLSSGKLLAAASDHNPQRGCGADVITRLMWAAKKENGQAKMREKVLSGINGLIDRVCKEAGAGNREIVRAVAAGNTVMSHFFAGKDTSGMAEAPFIPGYKGTLRMNGKKAGLSVNDEAEVVLLPYIAGHVGGDITAGIVATGICRKDKTSLFIDVGTNGEIVLMSEGSGVTCSTAAGPAFEGAGIRGSVLIDAVSRMLETGLMDRSGKISEERILIPGTEDIYISQEDVRQFQLAKGAIAAGIQICLDEMGKKTEDVDQILIGGAFGMNIKAESAIKTGLLPETDRGKVIGAGNAAGLGASMILLSEKSEKKAEMIPGMLKHIELADRDDFQKSFLDHMGF